MKIGINEQEEASKMTTSKIIEVLDKALFAPGYWRRKVIKWIFPEITGVANALRRYYWRDCS